MSEPNKFPSLEISHPEPHGWIQWKGTNVCMDVHCACGELTHFDGDFLYHVKCGACGKVYERRAHRSPAAGVRARGHQSFGGDLMDVPEREIYAQRKQTAGTSRRAADSRREERVHMAAITPLAPQMKRLQEAAAIAAQHGPVKVLWKDGKRVEP